MTNAYEREWEALAAARTLRSISTVSGRDEASFWRSGERTAGFLMSILPRAFTVRGSAIDFGIGLGRVALPLSRSFGEVRGVDVSRVMLDKLAEVCARRGIGNVSGRHVDEPWEEQPADLVYSVLTFQHMPDDEVRSALGRLRRACAGVGYFQFDTRGGRLVSDILSRLPARLLPWTLRPGMRRQVRDSAAVRQWLRAAGFSIEREFRQDSALHGFLVRPAGD